MKTTELYQTFAHMHEKGRQFESSLFCWDINKAHAAIMFNANDNAVSLVQWNDFDELARYYGTECDDWLGIDEAKPFETVSDGVNVYLKIK